MAGYCAERIEWHNAKLIGAEKERTIMVTVIEVVKAHLITNGFGGLVSSDSVCGCEIGDLFPCAGDSDSRQCEPGYKHVASQREWLDKNGWPYVVNASGRPIVGRWAARIRLAGVQPTATSTGLQPAGRPNFAALD